MSAGFIYTYGLRRMGNSKLDRLRHWCGGSYWLMCWLSKSLMKLSRFWNWCVDRTVVIFVIVEWRILFAVKLMGWFLWDEDWRVRWADWEAEGLPGQLETDGELGRFWFGLLSGARPEAHLSKYCNSINNWQLTVWRAFLICKFISLPLELHLFWRSYFIKILV